MFQNWNFLLAEIWVLLLLAALLGLLAGWMIWSRRRSRIVHEADSEELAERDLKISDLETLSQERQRNVLKLEGENKEIRAKLAELEQELDDPSTVQRTIPVLGVNNTDLGLDESDLRIAELEEDLRNSKKQMRELDELNHEYGMTIARLERDLEEAQSGDLGISPTDIASKDSRISELEAEAKLAGKRIIELEDAHATCQDTMAELQFDLAECRAAQASVETQSAPLLSTPPQSAAKAADTGAPLRLSGPRNGVADDLKRIKGIGPQMEELCNSLGFYHFDQLASWTAEEVAWVDQNLEGFQGRVVRDQWVEQAKQLALGLSTEFAQRVDKGQVPSSQ